MRITIKPHNRAYIELIKNQMECYDNSEVINYLILELKRLGYTFGAQLPVIPVTPISTTTNLQPTNTIGFTTDEQLAEQTDPIIDRLIALGLCEQSF